MNTDFKLQLKFRINSKRWKFEDDLAIPIGLRREAVAHFRRLTDRDYLGDHLHRMQVFNQPNCRSL